MASRRRRQGKQAGVPLQPLEPRTLLSAITMASAPLTLSLSAAGRVAVADFNGDGKADVAALKSTYNQAANVVGVYFGGEALSFTFSANYSASSYHSLLEDVAAGDFNGDGTPDLAFTFHNNSTDCWAALLLNLGNGTFGTPSFYALPPRLTPDPRLLCAGDFNGDGISDLAIRASAGVTLMSHAGGAHTRVDIPSAATAVALATGDFNGDGRSDLAVGATDGLTLYAASTSGTFSLFYTRSATVTQLLARDLNGDGYVDLAEITTGGNGVSLTIQLNSGFVGLLAPPTSILHSTSSSQTVLLAGACFNSDGAFDLVAFSGSTAQFYANQGDGTFAADTVCSFNGSVAQQIVAADLNSDGRADLLSFTATNKPLLLLPNAQLMTLSSAVDLPVPAATAPGVLAGDVNGDGKSDLVLRFPSLVRVLTGDSAGNFEVLGDFAVPAESVDFAFADFNLDGFPDLVVVGSTNLASVLLNLHDGRFAPAVNYLTGNDVCAVAVADLNRDGRPDFLTATRQYNNINTYLNRTDGTFTFQPGARLSGIPTAIAAADFDGNGIVDLACVSNSGNAMFTLIGDDHGGFWGTTTYTTPSPTALAVGDFNMDGLPDIMVGGSSITCFENIDHFEFSNKGSYAVAATRLLAADVDADGLPDLVVDNGSSGSVTVMNNRGGRAFSVVTSPAIDGVASALAVADVDGDSQRDVIATSTAGWSILYNTSTRRAVSGRHVFYNHSHFDAGTSGPGSADDLAIDGTKIPLLPGKIARFVNYTSAAAGINGVMIDLTGTLLPLTLSDLTFKVGNDLSPDGWADAPAPLSISQRPDLVAGGSRVEVIWADGAIRNQWLQVTLLGGDGRSSGVRSPDVFYFGNAVGECGNDTGNARVTAIDEIMARYRRTSAAGVCNPCDFDKDGIVGESDVTIARANVTWFQTQLQLIGVPALQLAAGAADLDPAPRVLVVPAASILMPAAAPLEATAGSVAPRTSAAVVRTSTAARRRWPAPALYKLPVLVVRVR